MKRWLLSVIGLSALGAAAYFWAGWSCACPHGREHLQAHHVGALPAERLPELEWLRRELALDDVQFEEVRRLHVAYLPQCEIMCRRIEEATRRVREVARARRHVTPELEAALAEESAVRRECQASLLRHLYATAACMNETQAQRYLDLIVPAALAPAAAAPTP